MGIRRNWNQMDERVADLVDKKPNNKKFDAAIDKVAGEENLTKDEKKKLRRICTESHLIVS